MRSILIVLLAVAWSALLAAAAGQAEIFSKGGLEISGDFRARLETDFDSQRADDSEREDRTRTRIRARLGLTYAAGDHFSFGARLRSGSDDSHQSPHITVLDFDGNDTGDAHFNLDKWYARLQGEKAWGWIGRNSLPFWKQNELFWDEDVTPAGLALGFRTSVGKRGNLQLNTGYFSLPVGMRDFAGNLGVGQLVFSSGRFTGAVGWLSFDADPGDVDAVRLLRGNGLRDYTLWVGSLQVTLEAGNQPLTLGADVAFNAEDYSASDPDPFTAANHDQTDGFVLSTKLGKVAGPGDWQVAYTYAEIETFAVNASYSQDDWMRWGSLTEIRSSDFEGHEFRFVYALEKNLQLVARLYLVEAITTEEDGGRFRMDFNYKF